MMMKKSSKRTIASKVAIGTAVILTGIVAQQLYVFLTFDEGQNTPTTTTQKKKKEIR